jgi:hypothetical protein
MKFRADLWPDWQSRLSVRSMAGKLNGIHGGSVHGLGAPVPQGYIEHHKLLCKTYDQRVSDVRHYDELEPNAGTATRHFYLPEEVPAAFVSRSCIE